MQMLGIQAMMAQSQMELNKAQANKMSAEADNIRGAEGTKGAAEIKLILQQELNEKLRANNIKADTWKKDTEGNKNWEQSQNMNMENEILRETLEEHKLGAIAEQVGKGIENELMQSKISLADEQTRKVYHDIIVNYVNAGVKGS